MVTFFGGGHSHVRGIRVGLCTALTMPLFKLLRRPRDPTFYYLTKQFPQSACWHPGDHSHIKVIPCSSKVDGTFIISMI